MVTYQNLPRYLKEMLEFVIVQRIRLLKMI